MNSQTNIHVFFKVNSYQFNCFIFLFSFKFSATTFLEMWKRRQSVLAWEWDMVKGDVDEEPRPEFETSVKTFRINPVTREREPYLPVWSRTMRYLATGSMVFFMVYYKNIVITLKEKQAPNPDIFECLNQLSKNV